MGSTKESIPQGERKNVRFREVEGWNARKLDV
jgi:hypothetical protein